MAADEACQRATGVPRTPRTQENAPPPGQPYSPRHRATVGSWEVAFSHERGTPVGGRCAGHTDSRLVSRIRHVDCGQVGAKGI